MSASIQSAISSSAQNRQYYDHSHHQHHSIEEHSSENEHDDFRRIAAVQEVDTLDIEKGVSRVHQLRKLSALTDFQDKSFTTADGFLRQEDAVSHPAQDNFKALLFINVCAIGMTIFGTGVQSLTANTGVLLLEVMLFRNLPGIFIQFALTRVYKQSIFSENTLKNYKTLMVRMFMPSISIASQVAALQYLSVSMVTVVYQTFPFWASIFAYFLLNEKVTRVEILGMTICFSAVITMAVSSQESTDSTSMSTNSALGFGLAFVFSLAMALNGTLARKASSVHFSVQLFILTLCGTIVACVGLLYVHLAGTHQIFAQSLTVYYYLALLGLVEVASGIGLTQAFRYGETSYVCLVGNAIIVYGFMADIMIFQTQISAMQGLGALIIVITLVTIGSLKVEKKI